MSAHQARIARTPPMPSSISCSSRCSEPPPYKRSVTSRSAGSLRSVLESSSSNGTRPTWAFHTWATQEPAAGEVEAHGERLARGVAHQGDRQLVGVEHRVVLLLPAVRRQRLLEVAAAIEQPHAEDRDPEVAGALEVVAGEDAESAGVLREHLGDAVLRGEVRDARRRRPVLACRGTGTSGSVEVALEVIVRGVQPPRGTRRPPPVTGGARAGPRRAAGWGRRRAGPTSRDRCATKRSRVGACQDQRRLLTSSPSGRERVGQNCADGEPADRSHEGEP